MAELADGKSGDIGKSGDPIEKRLLRYYGVHWKLFTIGALCSMGTAGLKAAFMWLIKAVIDAAEYGHTERLGQAAVLIVAIHIVKWGFSYGQDYYVASATNMIAMRLRNDLYSHLQRLSLSFYEQTRVGHVMSRMTNDVGLIQNSANQIIQAVSAPLTIVVMTVVIFTMNWKLSVICITLLPLMAYAMNRISRGMRRITDQLQSRLADVAARVQETLSAVRIVKSFGMEDYETSRFADENDRTYSAAMRAVRRNAAMSPTLELIGVTGVAAVLYLGGAMAAHSHGVGFTTGSLMAFLASLDQIAAAAREVGRLSSTFHSTMAGAARIFSVLDETPDIQDAPNAVALDSIQGRVEFRDVEFAYRDGEPVLSGVSFVAEPGQQVALVGPSGAGKSTIVNLIPRFYDVTGGAVMVDGRDVRGVTANSLRQRIGIVPQESILFSTTIRENIAYGRMDATEAEVIEAAKAANAHDFICKLPDGYDTMVGERGTRLSGGERQRVAIARALLRNPKLLILDEATSSLDVASEAVVQEALDRLMKNRTTIVIAHRLSTIVGADKILVMRDGQVVESGVHSELLAMGGLYAELYAVQSRGAEVLTEAV